MAQASRPALNLGMTPDDKPPRSQDDRPTQLTQPKKGKPIEIPVPLRKDVVAVLEKAAQVRDGAKK